MGNIHDMPLEEVLRQGLAEARELFFDRGSPLLAGYTLFLVRDKYKSEGQELPPEFIELQSRIESHVRDEYPEKIRGAIDQKDYKKAMKLFFAVAGHYNRKHQKFPLELFDLKEQIANNIDNPIFAEVYYRERFED